MCQTSFLVESMLPEGVEDRMVRVRPIPGSLHVVFDGEEGVGAQGDSPKFLPLTDNVNNGLVPVGFEILDLEVADLGFS